MSSTADSKRRPSPKSVLSPTDQVIGEKAPMWLFKRGRGAIIALTFVVASLLGFAWPLAAETAEEELADLKLAEGRVKIADIVHLYYLSPVLATIKHARAADPKLMALVDRLRLTVSNEVTFYPGAWAEKGAGGATSDVSVDAAYFWTKKELFWLAALQSLNHKTSSPTIQAIFTQYRALCREMRQQQQPMPWVSLGAIGETRRFGEIDKALAELPPTERKVVDDESRRISRQFMAYVLLHEIAHHYLGHVGKKITPEAARRLELEADEWALRLSASIGYCLVDVRAMFRLEARAEAERLAVGYPVPPTHPRWAKRASRLEWLLPQIPVEHPDVIRLTGSWPVETGQGLQYLNVELEFPREPANAGTMMSSLFIGDSTYELDGIVNHRESATYLWFRDFNARPGTAGTRYVIRIEDVLSHEPRVVWESVSLSQPGTSRISMFSMRPDYARDPEIGRAHV